MTSSNLICRDMQTGTKNSINPRGIQQYIGTEGWTCRRYGEAASGVKISEEEDKSIAETLRIAGVQLDEAYSRLARFNDRVRKEKEIVYFNDEQLGLDDKEWALFDELLDTKPNIKDANHSWGIIDVNGKQIQWNIVKKPIPTDVLVFKRIK